MVRRNAVVVLFCTVSAAAGLLATANPALAALAVFFATVVAGWRIAWTMNRDVFAPLIAVLAYLVLGLGIRGLALREGWLTNTYSIPLGDQSLTAAVWMLGALAAVACTLGYVSRTGEGIGNRWRSHRWATEPMPDRAASSFAVLCALVGVASLVLLWRRYGGITGFGFTPAVVASRTDEGGQFTTTMLAYFPLVGLLVGWGRNQRSLAGKVATAVNIGVVIGWFLLAGRKSLLFELLLAVLVMRHYQRRRIRGRTLLIAAFPALVIVSLAFYFKAYGFRSQAIAAQYSQRPAWEAVVDPLLDRSYQFDAATMIMNKTRAIGDFRYGGTLQELLWFYVPRQWWSSKPPAFGYEFAPEFFPGASLTASYTPSMVGELYLDFSVFGVAGGCYLLGVGLRASYSALAGRRSQMATATYAVVLYELTFLVEGPIATHLEFLAAGLLPVVVLGLWSRLPGLRRQQAPGRTPVPKSRIPAPVAYRAVP